MRRPAALLVLAWPAVAAADPQNGDAIDVVVGGARSSRTAGSVHVVRKDQLDRFEHDDPHKVMLQIPGVFVRGEDAFGLRPNIGMRGASSDRSKKVTLLEDGVLLAPAPYSAPAAYYFPLLTRMTGVRVVKGPSAVAYGPQTIGGAVDLVTRDIPAGAAGAIDLAYGSFGYRKAHGAFGFSQGRWGFLVEGIHVGSQGFKQIDHSNADTGFSRNEWMVKGRFVPAPDEVAQNTFELKAGWSDEDSRETYLGLSDDDFRARPYRRYAASSRDRMRWTRTQLALTHRVRPARDLEIRTTAYRNDLHRVWDRFHDLSGASVLDVLSDPASGRSAAWYGMLTGRIDSPAEDQGILLGPNDRTFVSQGIQTVLRWTPRTGPVAHQAEMGFRLHFDAADRRHERTLHLVERGDLVRGGTTRTVADSLATTHAIALHLMDSATWGRVTLSPGIRLESIRSRLDDRRSGTTSSSYDLVALPGAGAHVALTRELGLLGGVHRGFSPAPPGARARPEEAVTWEWGARWAPRSARVEVIGFWADYSNVTALCSESSGCLDRNVDRQISGGAARIAGLEAWAEAAPKLRGFSFPLRGAYTLAMSEFLTSFTAGDPIWGRVRAGDEMPYVPIHQLYAQAGVEKGPLALNVSGTYVGDMRVRPGQGEVDPRDLTDAYFLLDAGASYRARRWFQVYLQGRNLLDQAYLAARHPYGARPGAPLTVMLGVKAEL